MPLTPPDETTIAAFEGTEIRHFQARHLELVEAVKCETVHGDEVIIPAGTAFKFAEEIQPPLGRDISRFRKLAETT